MKIKKPYEKISKLLIDKGNISTHDLIIKNDLGKDFQIVMLITLFSKKK